MTSPLLHTPTSNTMVPFVLDFNILQQFLLGDCWKTVNKRVNQIILLHVIL